jgi:hypothetical protein
VIGYGGVTWCPYSEACNKGKECDRAVTEEVMDKATEWWGSADFPIIMYAGQPECYDDVQPED